MTFELTPEPEKSPEELIAMSKMKAKQDARDTRLGCVMLIALAGIVVAAGFGLKSCLSGMAEGSKPERLEPEVSKAERAAAIAEGRDRDAVERDPEHYVIVDYTTGSDGSISGKLINNSDFFISNIKVRCEERGQSGKRLDRSTLVISETLAPRTTVPFGPLFVTWLDQQTVRLDCGPTDADVG
ncbi:MAG: hypothetical protein EON58_02480 [Alphaproteobacteria bacterium]|nr:MAG: hypothetical protein EON58_02480 [Alphaproteobacteria bacterium]